MHTFRDGRAGTVIHVEPRQSLTASNADEWIRNAPGTEGQLALAILKVMVDEGLADRRFGEVVEAIDVNAVAEESGVPVATHQARRRGLRARPSLASPSAGGWRPSDRTPPPTLAAINLLNAAAGNVGKTVRFGPDSAYGEGHAVRGGRGAGRRRWARGRSRCSCSARA